MIASLAVLGGFTDGEERSPRGSDAADQSIPLGCVEPGSSGVLGEPQDEVGMVIHGSALHEEVGDG